MCSKNHALLNSFCVNCFRKLWKTYVNKSNQEPGSRAADFAKYPHFISGVRLRALHKGGKYENMNICVLDAFIYVLDVFIYVFDAFMHANVDFYACMIHL